MLSASTTQPPAKGLKKSVSWKGVFVREYNCTVGDHPMCSDNLPVSLDWSHSDDVEVRTIESSRERKANYVFPKRLSYEDRARRIFGDGDEVEVFAEDTWTNEPDSVVQVEGAQQSMLNLDEALGHDEIEVDASHGVIYSRHLQDDVDDEDDDDDDSVNYFMDWNRLI